MKNNLNWIIVGGLILLMVFMKPGSLKMAGESDSRSFTMGSVYTNQVITVSIDVNPGDGTYYAVDEVVPSGWTVTGVSDGGDYTTNPGHVQWIVIQGAVPITYTYTVNPNGNTGVQTFTGTIGFENLPSHSIGGTPSITVIACSSTTETCNGVDQDCNYVIDNGVSEACGAGNCLDTRICQSPSCPDATTCQAGGSGTWNNCQSFNNDCGTCCLCTATGVEGYDGTQDNDCTDVTCPADDCNVDTCGLHIYGDYPATISNDCQTVYTCTDPSPICAGSAVCVDDSIGGGFDGDGYAGIFSAFTSCYDCDNTDAEMYYGYPLGEVCGDGKDNDCTGAPEVYFNEADWGAPGGFCNVGNGDCCDNDISMNELLDAIGQWKVGSFLMDDLLSSIGAWKV